jgi:hypothetical protein
VTALAGRTLFCRPKSPKVALHDQRDEDVWLCLGVAEIRPDLPLGSNDSAGPGERRPRPWGPTTTGLSGRRVIDGETEREPEERYGISTGRAAEHRAMVVETEFSWTVFDRSANGPSRGWRTAGLGCCTR